MFWSQEFGLVIANKKRLVEVNHPHGMGSYWEDPIAVERACLCNRRLTQITPELNTNFLFSNTTIKRQTGNGWRHEWRYSYDRAPDEPERDVALGLSIWVRRVLHLLDKFAVVTSRCTAKITNNPVFRKPSEYGKYTDPPG